MFTDTHCHLYHEYYEDIEEVINNAKEKNISSFFVAGCDQSSNEEVLRLTKYYKDVYGCIGIHPENIFSYQDEDLKWLEDHLCEEKIIAIGEIGLDYHYDKSSKLEQIALFERQLDLASKYHLPVVIHSRDATEDTISILKKYPSVKGVIHSFSGSLETAKIYISMGYKLGINGVVTFKNSHLKEILPKILNQIVLETDSPYLAPHPLRGTQNEPLNIAIIVDFICDYCNINREELEKITIDNIRCIFDI